VSDIGVLVKVPAELHSALKQASGQHKRSMQKVVLALLEGWLQNGAPDPLTYGASETPEGKYRSSSIEDKRARAALMELAADFRRLESRVAKIEKRSKSEGRSDLDFDAFFEELRRAANSEQTENADIG
jgi:hypothetical protein